MVWLMYYVAYQDVFPKSLPAGLPPERSVDHRIKLEPGAPPPSRPTYRLSHKELEDLHTQVKDYVAKWVDTTQRKPVRSTHTLCEEEGWDYADVHRLPGS